jgi:uridine phosphorylase
MTIDFDLPQNRQGRYYHLNCGPGDLASYIFTCGDPARARRIAGHFDRIALRRLNREFRTYTGTYRNIPVSVIATGIGAPASAIAVVEAAQCAPQATFIRLGSTGALQAHINVGDLIITTAALRDDGASHYYAPPEVTARAHPQVVAALTQAADALKVPHHLGVTCTTADFYAGQGRVVPGFPTLDPEKVQHLSRAGVLNLEMEMAAYLTLAQVSTLKLRAGGACAVVNNRLRGGVFASPRLFRLTEQRLIEVGFKAVEILAGKD